jgi:hypothetical protein
MPTFFHPDGTAVSIFEQPAGNFYLLVRYKGCERSREISFDEARRYKAFRSIAVELFVTQMRAELEHAIRQGEATVIRAKFCDRARTADVAKR